MPSAESLSELGEILEQTRLDVSGGDPQARETLKSAHAMIDEAAQRDAIHPAVLIVLGRLFAGAKIDIGCAARAAMERIVDRRKLLDSGVDAYSAFVQPLVLAARDGPFALYEEIGALIAIFPLAYRSSFIESLAADSNTLARQAAIGFLLHREEALAAAAFRRLGAAAMHGDLDAESRRRLETVRP